jgi:hypothetical protein
MKEKEGLEVEVTCRPGIRLCRRVSQLNEYVDGLNIWWGFFVVVCWQKWGAVVIK